MSKSDEEIQKMLEKRSSILPHEESIDDDQQDLKIYSRLFDELSQAPEVKLTYSFSANVIRKIRQQKQRRSEIRLTLLVTVFVITGLVGLAGSAYFNEILPAIANSKWLIFAGLLVLTVVQFLDQKLILERRLPK